MPRRAQTAPSKSSEFEKHNGKIIISHLSTFKVIEMKDEKIEIDAFKIALLFIYNAYKGVELTGETALSVLYIGIFKLIYWPFIIGFF